MTSGGAAERKENSILVARKQNISRKKTTMTKKKTHVKIRISNNSLRILDASAVKHMVI